MNLLVSVRNLFVTTAILSFTIVFVWLLYAILKIELGYSILLSVLLCFIVYTLTFGRIKEIKKLKRK